jgi:hypothetical protein
MAVMSRQGISRDSRRTRPDFRSIQRDVWRQTQVWTNSSFNKSLRIIISPFKEKICGTSRHNSRNI